MVTIWDIILHCLYVIACSSRHQLLPSTASACSSFNVSGSSTSSGRPPRHPSSSFSPSKRLQDLPQSGRLHEIRSSTNAAESRCLGPSSDNVAAATDAVAAGGKLPISTDVTTTTLRRPDDDDEDDADDDDVTTTSGSYVMDLSAERPSEELSRQLMDTYRGMVV